MVPADMAAAATGEIEHLRQRLVSTDPATTDGELTFALSGRVVSVGHSAMPPWTVEVSIDWTVRDWSTGLPIYLAVTRGSAERGASSGAEAIGVATRNALDELLARPGLDGALSGGGAGAVLAPARDGPPGPPRVPMPVRPPTVRDALPGVRIAGIVLVAGGAAAAGATWALAMEYEIGSAALWTQATFINTMGWGAAATGGAMLGLSFIPPRPGKPPTVAWSGTF